VLFLAEAADTAPGVTAAAVLFLAASETVTALPFAGAVVGFANGGAVALVLDFLT